jgi:hypothetical protein
VCITLTQSPPASAIGGSKGVTASRAESRVPSRGIQPAQANLDVLDTLVSSWPAIMHATRQLQFYASSYILESGTRQGPGHAVTGCIIPDSKGRFEGSPVPSQFAASVSVSFQVRLLPAEPCRIAQPCSAIKVLSSARQCHAGAPSCIRTNEKLLSTNDGETLVTLLC